MIIAVRLTILLFAILSSSTFAAPAITYEELLRVQCIRTVEADVPTPQAAYSCDATGAMDPRSRAYLDNNPEYIYKSLGSSQPAVLKNGLLMTVRSGIIECFAVEKSRTHCQSLSAPSESDHPSNDPFEADHED